MQQWWYDHGLVLTGTMLAITLAGFVFVLLVLRRLPADYFVKLSQLPPRHPVLRMIRSGIRNLLGFALLIVGLVMSIPLVPGPGLLAILVGFSLISIPGNRKVGIWILRLPLFSSCINRLRRNTGRPPLLLPSYDGERAHPKGPQTNSHLQ